MRFGGAIRILAGRLGRRAFRPVMRDRASIFMLHRIEDHARGVHGHKVEFVREALSALAESGATFVPLSRMIEQWRSGAPVDPDWVAFTIDDGFADQATLVREAFMPMRCPVTVFLITGFLDRKLWPWDDQVAHVFRTATVASAVVPLQSGELEVKLDTQHARNVSIYRVRERCKKLPNEHLYETVAEIARALGTHVPDEPPAEYTPMSWDEARELERQGVEFGPHSYSHRIFSALSDEEARTEIATSHSRLAAELSRPLPIFAWPTGRDEDYSPRDIAIAQDVGLHASVATNSDYAHVPSDSGRDALYRIRRFGLPNDVPTVLRYGSWLERGRQLLPI